MKLSMVTTNKATAKQGKIVVGNVTLSTVPDDKTSLSASINISGLSKEEVAKFEVDAVVDVTIGTE